MNPEFNDARSWKEVNCKASVRCEDCCVVAQNCKLRVAYPRHLIRSCDALMVVKLCQRESSEYASLAFVASFDSKIISLSVII